MKLIKQIVEINNDYLQGAKGKWANDQCSL